MPLILRRSLWLVAGLGLVVLAAPLGCSVVGIRTTEEPDHEVLVQDGEFALREYPAIVVAETTVQEGFDDAGGESFRRLFAYISGDNREQQDLAMTAPVMAEPAGELSRRGPSLSTQGADGAWTFAFVLPADQTLDSAPRPTNPEVRLREIPPRKVAVLRGSGSWDEDELRARSDALQGWIVQQGWTAVSAPCYAGYDPPWTLPFLRRNEVLVEVVAEGPASDRQPGPGT